jgi:hypothetical protein
MMTRQVQVRTKYCDVNPISVIATLIGSAFKLLSSILSDLTKAAAKTITTPFNASAILIVIMVGMKKLREHLEKVKNKTSEARKEAEKEAAEMKRAGSSSSKGASGSSSKVTALIKAAQKKAEENVDKDFEKRQAALTKKINEVVSANRSSAEEDRVTQKTIEATKTLIVENAKKSSKLPETKNKEVDEQVNKELADSIKKLEEVAIAGVKETLNDFAKKQAEIDSEVSRLTSSGSEEALKEAKSLLTKKKALRRTAKERVEKIQVQYERFVEKAKKDYGKKQSQLLAKAEKLEEQAQELKEKLEKTEKAEAKKAEKKTKEERQAEREAQRAAKKAAKEAEKAERANRLKAEQEAKKAEKAALAASLKAEREAARRAAKEAAKTALVEMGKDVGKHAKNAVVESVKSGMQSRRKKQEPKITPALKQLPTSKAVQKSLPFGDDLRRLKDKLRRMRNAGCL